MCQVGEKGKLRKGKVDPNAVTPEAKSGEQKASFYLKLLQKKKTKADKRIKRQSSKQNQTK